MIKSKSDFSDLCKAIRQAIIDNGDSIKLSSVRERVAQSFSFKSVNELVARLPVTLSDEFWDALPQAFASKHGIEWDCMPWSIRYPETFPLSTSEKETIWNRACSRNAPFEDPEPDTTMDGNELRSDGKGGWYFKFDAPWMASYMPGFNWDLDPDKTFYGDELTLFELRLSRRRHSDFDKNTYLGPSNIQYSDDETSSLDECLQTLGIAHNENINDLPLFLSSKLNDLPEIKHAAIESDWFDVDIRQNLYPIIKELLTNGLAYTNYFMGDSSYEIEPGYIQLFFLSLTDGDTDDIKPFHLGDYYVKVTNRTKTRLSKSLFLNSLSLYGKVSPVPFSDRRTYGPSYDIARTIEDSLIFSEEMIRECVNDKQFPFIRLIGMADDESDLDDLRTYLDFHIDFNESEQCFVIRSMPMAHVLQLGQDIDTLLSFIREVITVIDTSEYGVIVKPDLGEHFAENINASTVLSVIYQRGRIYNHAESAFGHYEGYIKHNIVSDWLKGIGVVEVLANAFIDPNSGDWQYLSIAGFDKAGDRICIIGISFYGNIEVASWQEWINGFDKDFGVELYINETYEFNWALEDDPNADLPYLIPKTPSSTKRELGKGVLFFGNGVFDRARPAILPKEFNKQIFCRNDLSISPPFRITPPIKIPKLEDPLSFLNEVIDYADPIDIRNDLSWASFMTRMLEYEDKISVLSQEYYIASFVLTEGGSNALFDLTVYHLPSNPNSSGGEKFNVYFEDDQLSKIAKAMGLTGVNGIDFYYKDYRL